MRYGFIAASSLLFLACGITSSQAPPDRPGLMAMAPRPSGTLAVSPASVSAVQVSACFAEEVLRDPAERFALVEQLRTEIVHRTRAISEARWRGEVRPDLRRQLARAGLAVADVDFLLWEIDQARGPR
jgi:hypothetical protein